MGSYPINQVNVIRKDLAFNTIQATPENMESVTVTKSHKGYPSLKKTAKVEKSLLYNNLKFLVILNLNDTIAKVDGVITKHESD